MNQPDEIAAKRARLLTAYRGCFSGESGALVLADLEQSVGYGRPSFLRPAAGQPYDPLAAAIRDGRKSVLDEIHDRLAIPADATPKGPEAVGGA